MKIAFITTMHGFQWGGSEELWFRLAKYALDQECRVAASIFDYGSEHSNITQLKNSGATIFYKQQPSSYRLVPPKKFYLRLIDNYFLNKKKPAIPFTYDKLLKWEPDIVLISEGHTFEIIHDQDLILLLKKLNVPYYLLSQFHEETGKNLDFRKEMIRIIESSKKIFFVSKRNWEVANRQLAYSITNGHVIHNPANINEKGILDYSEEETAKFAYVARLQVSVKGHDILLHIFSGSQWVERNWHLSLYGSGPDLDYITELISFYNLQHKVTIKGQVDDIRKVWKENHLLVMPSLGEGTPLALLEAMLCGRTAVITDVGGNCEFIVDNESGFVADTASDRSFGSALEKAWAKKDKWSEMGRNAYYTVSYKLDFNPEITLFNEIFTKK